MDGSTLLAGLADGSLPPQAFTHRNHVRAAWQCLIDCGDQAPDRFLGLLAAYTRGLGAEAKLHVTLTRALMQLIDARRRAGEDWDAFAECNPALFDDARALLARHYSDEALAEGRTAYVAPDRLPLP